MPMTQYTVLVPEHSDVDLADEFAHVKVWVSINRLKLNFDKTKEIAFSRPRAQDFHMPPMIDDIEQLNCCKLLGVIFQHNLKMDSHVLYIMSQCAQRMYLLKLLRQQGMPPGHLSVVARSIIVSRILDVLPAWGGFLSADHINK